MSDEGTASAVDHHHDAATVEEVPGWFMKSIQDHMKSMERDRAMMLAQQGAMAMQMLKLANYLESCTQRPSQDTSGGHPPFPMPTEAKVHVRRRWWCWDCFGVCSICYGCAQFISVLLLLGVVTFLFIFVVDKSRDFINWWF